MGVLFLQSSLIFGYSQVIYCQYQNKRRKKNKTKNVDRGVRVPKKCVFCFECKKQLFLCLNNNNNSFGVFLFLSFFDAIHFTWTMLFNLLRLLFFCLECRHTFCLFVSVFGWLQLCELSVHKIAVYQMKIVATTRKTKTKHTNICSWRARGGGVEYYCTNLLML